MDETSSTETDVSGLAWFLDLRNWPLVPTQHAGIPSPPRPPLPPTPDPLDSDCEEIIDTDTVDDQFFSDLFSGRARGQHNQPVPNFSLPTPWLKNGAVVLPGICSRSRAGELKTDVCIFVVCSGVRKRSAPEDSEHRERPQKTARTNYEAPQPCVADEDDDIVYGEPHADDGIIGGKYCCTCGKAYTKPYALKRHIVAAGTSRYECAECGKMFGRKDSLRRHDQMEHKGNRISCPGCQRYFRPDYLTKHLASAQRESCRNIAEALYLETYGLNIDVRPVADRFWIPNVARRVPYRTGGRAVWQDTPDWSHSLEQDVQGLANTLQHYQGIKMRPVLRDKREPCALCGMPLGSNEMELIDHIKHHSLELSTSTYRCDACQIDFKFAADLHLHLEAAATGHCGFKFFHVGHDPMRCGSGHHPPCDPKVYYDNHDRMQAMVTTWQGCQFRAHRVAIARLQAELLLYGQYLRHSLGDDELMCMELLSRFSIESIDSFRSVPDWVEFQDKMQTDGPETRPHTGSAPSQLESTTLSSVSLGSSPETAPSAGTPEGSRNTYIDQLKAMRSPGGLKSKASGIRYRAKAAKRYLLPSDVLGDCKMHYVSIPAA